MVFRKYLRNHMSYPHGVFAINLRIKNHVFSSFKAILRKRFRKISEHTVGCVCFSETNSKRNEGGD